MESFVEFPRDLNAIPYNFRYSSREKFSRVTLDSSREVGCTSTRSNRHWSSDRSIDRDAAAREARRGAPRRCGRDRATKARKPQRRGRAVSPHFGIPSSNKLYRAGSQCSRESLPELSRLFFLFFSRDLATPFLDQFETSGSARISWYLRNVPALREFSMKW